MNMFITAIVIGGVIGYVAVIVRLMGSTPSGRYDYAEKELTDTFYDYSPTKKGRVYKINNDGSVIRRDQTIRRDLCGC